jgi:hypothetical protein
LTTRLVKSQAILTCSTPCARCQRIFRPLVDSMMSPCTCNSINTWFLPSRCLVELPSFSYMSGRSLPNASSQPPDPTHVNRCNAPNSTEGNPAYPPTMEAMASKIKELEAVRALMTISLSKASAKLIRTSTFTAHKFPENSSNCALSGWLC